MTLDPAAAAVPRRGGRGGRGAGAGRGERRRLARRDRDAARLAELHHLRSLLAGAAAVVGAGWVQHAWFQCRDADGRLCTVTEGDLDLLADRPVTGACLVGAVVHAAGGPATAGSQVVRRTLDLLWRTLHRDADDGTEPGGWCPAPAVRAARVQDLTRWNDAPTRTGADVARLLAAAQGRADAEAARLRPPPGPAAARERAPSSVGG